MQQLAATSTTDLEKELIFGHGHDFHQTSFVTTNQLFYTDHNQLGDSYKTDSVMKITGAVPKNDMSMQKRRQWQVCSTLCTTLLRVWILEMEQALYLNLSLLAWLRGRQLACLWCRIVRMHS